MITKKPLTPKQIRVFIILGIVYVLYLCFCIYIKDVRTMCNVEVFGHHYYGHVKESTVFWNDWVSKYNEVAKHVIVDERYYIPGGSRNISGFNELSSNSFICKIDLKEEIK